MSNEFYTELIEAQKALLEKVEEVKKEKATITELKELEEKVLKQLDTLDLKLKKTERAVESEISEERKLFSEWLRKGVVPEGKALKLGEDPTGGYLAPVEFVKEIIKAIVEYSPIRNLATVRSTSAVAIRIPKRTKLISATWTSEAATRTETATSSPYGSEFVNTHELYALADISFDDLEDPVVNVESHLIEDFSEQFGVAEGQAFVLGNGRGKPEGFLVNESVERVVAGSTSEISYNALLNLYGALKTAYSTNAKFLMNRKTLVHVLGIKDTQNRPILILNPASNLPMTIFGKEIVEVVDMPDISANTLPVAFGDFSKGYLIVDRLAVSVIRDPYSQASSGMIRFHARKRVGGQVVLAEAIKLLKMSAS